MCFSIQSQHFLRNVNISLRSRDIHVQVRPGMSKIALFREFSNTKIALKMSQNRENLHPKWLLNMFGDVFHVSTDTRPYKTKKSSNFWILGNISQKSIFMKNGSRNL